MYSRLHFNHYPLDRVIQNYVIQNLTFGIFYQIHLDRPNTFVILKVFCGSSFKKSRLVDILVVHCYHNVYYLHFGTVGILNFLNICGRQMHPFDDEKVLLRSLLKCINDRGQMAVDFRTLEQISLYDNLFVFLVLLPTEFGLGMFENLVATLISRSKNNWIISLVALVPYNMPYGIG